jgi:hypothetical protein
LPNQAENHRTPNFHTLQEYLRRQYKNELVELGIESRSGDTTVCLQAISTSGAQKYPVPEEYSVFRRPVIHPPLSVFVEA